jgi:hypothetical protein
MTNPAGIHSFREVAAMASKVLGSIIENFDNTPPRHYDLIFTACEDMLAKLEEISRSPTR